MEFTCEGNQLQGILLTARTNQKPVHDSQSRQGFRNSGTKQQSDTGYTKSYAEVGKGYQNDRYNVPTSNFWNNLNY